MKNSQRGFVAPLIIIVVVLIIVGVIYYSFKQKPTTPLDSTVSDKSQTLTYENNFAKFQISYPSDYGAYISHHQDSGDHILFIDSYTPAPVDYNPNDNGDGIFIAKTSEIEELNNKKEANVPLINAVEIQTLASKDVASANKNLNEMESQSKVDNAKAVQFYGSTRQLQFKDLNLSGEQAYTAENSNIYSLHLMKDPNVYQLTIVKNYKSSKRSIILTSGQLKTLNDIAISFKLTQ